MTTTRDGKTLPNKAFDMEYSTEYKREMLYLKERGFDYVFKKHTSDYNIPVYKYTKTPALLRAVADFYEQIENERSYAKANLKIQNAKYVCDAITFMERVCRE